MKKQQLKDKLSLLHKECKVLIKIMKKKDMKKIQKKLINQIFQRIENKLTMQQDLIMLLCKLKSEDVALHVISLEI